MERDVLVVGESLVDIVNAADGETKEYAGGSAANVAVALARLGRPVRFATSFADDDHGRLVAEHLSSAGVRRWPPTRAPSAGPRRPRPRSGWTGPRTTSSTSSGGSTRSPSEPDPLVVHTCSLGAVLSPGADDVVALLERLREAATVSYDVNARPGDHRHRAGRRRPGGADGGHRGPGQGLRRGPRGALPAARTRSRRRVACCPWARPQWWSPGARRGRSGSARTTWSRSTPARSRWPTRSAPATPSARPSLDALWEAGRLGADRREALRELDRGQIEGVLAHAARAAAVTVSRPGADPPYRHELA